MRFLQLVFSLLLLNAITACNRPPVEGGMGEVTIADSPQPTALTEDGMYLILKSGDSSLTANNGVLINFSHHFLGDNTEGQPTRLEIDTNEFVPLYLQQRPDSIMQSDGRMNLLLTMTPDAGKRLEEFTGAHIMDYVALVIGGEAVSMHKIKARIEGGKLQITRCTDNACEYLFYELVDNVTKETP